jgi:hypothetical protein
MDRSKFDELMKLSAPTKEPPESLSGITKDQYDEQMHSEASSNEVQLKFNVVEATRISLEPNDVLFITVNNDDLDQESINNLAMQLKPVFSNNKVFVMAVGTRDNIKFSIVSQETPIAKSENVGYCGDCSCGKKEQIEGSKE